MLVLALHNKTWADTCTVGEIDLSSVCPNRHEVDVRLIVWHWDRHRFSDKTSVPRLEPEAGKFAECVLSCCHLCARLSSYRSEVSERLARPTTVSSAVLGQAEGLVLKVLP